MESGSFSTIERVQDTRLGELPALRAKIGERNPERLLHCDDALVLFLRQKPIRQRRTAHGGNAVTGQLAQLIAPHVIPRSSRLDHFSEVIDAHRGFEHIGKGPVNLPGGLVVAMTATPMLTSQKPSRLPAKATVAHRSIPSSPRSSCWGENDITQLA